MQWDDRNHSIKFQTIKKSIRWVSSIKWYARQQCDLSLLITNGTSLLSLHNFKFDYCFIWTNFVRLACVFSRSNEQFTTQHVFEMNRFRSMITLLLSFPTFPKRKMSFTILFQAANVTERKKSAILDSIKIYWWHLFIHLSQWQTLNKSLEQQTSWSW